MFLVQETWLEPGIDPQIANYRLTKDDRIEIPHTVTRGGTAIYCKNEIVHNRVLLPNLQGMDATAKQIKINNFPPINIVSVYVRKRVDHNFPIEDFKNIFNSGSNCIIAGDYNAAHSHRRLPHTSNRASGVERLSTWRCSSTYLSIRVLNDLSSDHYPVILELNLNTSIIKKPEQLSTSWFNFKFALKKKPLPTVDLASNENIELAISELNQNFSEAFVEASKPKFNNAPKILSPEIKYKIYQRNRLRKFWQRTRRPSIYSEFRTLSREIAKDIQADSRAQWEKHIEALLPVDNTLWRKSSLLRKPFQSISPLKGALGSIAITPIEKAEVIADSLQEQFEPNHVVGRELFDQRIHDEVTNFINTPHVQEIEPTTPTEVLSYVQRLKPRKSPGLDQISNLYEFVLLQRLNQHCTASNFIIPQQCGFRPKCSTVHQLLKVTELIHSGFAKHEATRILFLDIAKAFDKIWHDGLLIKLIRLDFPPPLIKSIHSFLSNRAFRVRVDSSDHNPVIFDFVINCQLPPLLQTLKTTNWIEFQEILHYNMPGNPTVDNLNQAIQNFSNIVSDAINTSTSTKISKTSHLRLPINIRELIKTKNRFRKLWNNTRYPLYKREVNALVRQIRNEINEHKNRTWKNLLSSLNVEDNSLYNLHKRITKKYTVIPLLHGPSGLAFSDFEKAEAFKDTLEVTFQENAEPYNDDKIEEVESV
ncbi:RNA-directed DNA polymerase from mobile element jockey [Trichonephila clavipes]|nr:RNA-directed DNA polymerase from mobile element jockey [Trichonephila clavipes]